MEKLLGNLLYTKIQNTIKWSDLYEIRIRFARPILLKTKNKDIIIDFYPERAFFDNIISVATNNSRYAYENEISDGYLEYKEGIRIGICGKGKISEKNLIAYTKITSVCIRIPHVIPLSNNFSNLLQPFQNTLIVGPPFSGKTTLIRSFCEEISRNFDVVLFDERQEIAGENYSLLRGDRLDVVQNIKKEYIYDKIIRSMSPQIVVCDELLTENDFHSVKKIISSGIKCLASYHGTSSKSIPSILKECFNVYVTISSIPKVGSILSIERKND